MISAFELSDSQNRHIHLLANDETFNGQYFVTGVSCSCLDIVV